MSSARPLPRGGRAPAALQTALLWARAFAYLQSLRRRCGSRFTLRVPGHLPLVFVCDAEGIGAIHTESEESLGPGEGAAAVAPIVGERSFMLAHGAQHAFAREALRAALSGRELERHRAMVSAAASAALRDWPREEPIALHPRLRELTLQILLRLLLGLPDGPLPVGVTELRDAVLSMLDVTRLPLLTETYLRRLGPGRRAWRRFLANRERVDIMLGALIEAQLSGGRGGGLLGTLCALRKADGSRCSAVEVRDNVMSVILAGHETTAAQLSWAIHLLAHNPQAQHSLIAEIDEGNEDRYLRATVQEALRHRCVFVFGIPRQLIGSVRLAGHEYQAPAQLLPCTYLLHHDAQHFPDPERFEPERFLESADLRAFLPWGGGRRRCPGAQLAMLELASVLRVILTACALEPAAERIERPRWRSVIVVPHRGGRVILRDRAGQ